jgi:hypothetical protein
MEKSIEKQSISPGWINRLVPKDSNQKQNSYFSEIGLHDESGCFIAKHSL